MQQSPVIIVGASPAGLAMSHCLGGRRGYLRQAWGAGWALAGDAGYFKDPLTAHGLTDALRDAELLARAAACGSEAAFAGYVAMREVLSLPLLAATNAIASFA
jgi:2-polyprenyl-6-methoxyphenol hydroxylase-like FAD-dependent oxidoreductase